MPILNITNVSRYKLPINDIIGILEKGESRSLELTLNEIERSRTQLVALTNYGLIKWSTEANDDPTDDAAEGSLISGSTSSNPVTDVYISGLNGNDGNNGLTPNSAVKTWARVWELLPKTVTKPFVVHIGASGGAGYDYVLPPDDRIYADGAFIVLYGDGAGQSGEDGFTEIESGVLGAGTTDHVLQIATSPAEDAYTGHTIEIINGTASGYRRHIRDNAGDLVTPNQTYEDLIGFISPSAGDGYRILQPAATLKLPSTGTTQYLGVQRPVSAFTNSSTPLHVINVTFQNFDTDIYTVFRIESPILRLFFGVEITAGSQTFYTEVFGAISTGVTAALRSSYQSIYLQLMAAIGHTPIFGDWLGWGISGITSKTPIGLEQGETQGYFVTQSSLVSNNLGSIMLFGGRASVLAALYGGRIIINPSSTKTSSTKPISFLIVPTSTALSCGGQSSIGGTLILPLSYNSSTGAALEIRSTASTPAVPLDFGDGSLVSLWGNISIDLPNYTSSTVISCDEGSKTAISGRNIIQLNVPSASWAVTVRSGAILTIEEGFSATPITAQGGFLVEGGDVSIINGSMNITATTNPAIRVSEAGRFAYGCTVGSTLQSSIVNGAVIEVSQDSSFIQRTTSASLTITNNNGAATSDAVRVSSSGKVNLRGSTNTTLNVAASGGYGVNARFGGKVYFEAQPNISGGAGYAGDLIVDTVAGASNATTLASSESAIHNTTNGSLIARAN